MLSWNELIALAHERRASDVHMVCGLPFLCRVDGRVERLTEEPLTRAQCEQYAQQLAGEEYEALREIGERDLSCSFECGVRVRVNLFCQQDAVSAAVRLLADGIPALESLAFGPNCFEMLTTLRFSSVPALTTVSASAYACYNVREVDLFSRCVGAV